MEPDSGCVVILEAGESASLALFQGKNYMPTITIYFKADLFTRCMLFVHEEKCSSDKLWFMGGVVCWTRDHSSNPTCHKKVISVFPKISNFSLQIASNIASHATNSVLYTLFLVVH